MEGELGNSKKSLSSLIENVPGIVYRSEFDEDWTMRFLSESCSEITGYEPSELIDNKRLAWSEIIHPEDRERVWSEIKEELKKNEQFKVTYRITTKEGKEKWMWEQGTAVKGNEGNIEGLEGFITDITEKLEYQNRLEKREKKVKELYEASTKLERCRTKQEVYELAIQSAEKILGFYTSVLFAESDGNLEVKQSANESSFEKGDLLSLKDENLMVNSYLNNDTYLAKDIPNQEGVGATQEGLKSGIAVPIGDMGLFAAASKEKYHFDEFDLEMAKILASHINETVKRIDSQQEKSLILETAEEHILYLDADLNIQWANEEVERFAEVEKDQVVGEKCYEIMKDRTEICENCPVEKAINSGKREEGLQKDEDGSYWLIRATPRLDEDGEVEGVVEIALDITQRKRAEERLKKNKEKIEGLLKATSKLEKQHDIDNIYEVAMDAIENILEIDFGALFVLDDDRFFLKAETSSVPSHDIKPRDKDDGVLGKTFRTKKPDITDDIQSSEDANNSLENFRSGISVPLGDFGVFQAMSKEKGHFDHEDLNMLKLLSNHMIEAVKRVELHNELERSEKRFRTLFEESPISIWEEDFSKLKRYLGDLKESGIEDFEEYFKENPEETRKFTELVEIEDVNKAALEMFKAENKEEIAENFDKILKDEAEEGVIKELVAVANDEDTFETSGFVNYTLDGEKRYFYLKWANIGGDEDYSKVIVSLVDITQLKETQRKLRKSEKKYRAIFENSGTPMIISDDDGTITLANEEFSKISGYPSEELEGKKKWTEFVSEEDQDKMIEYHEKRIKEKESVPSRYTFKFVNRFGDVRDIFVQVGEMPDSDQEISSWMDITDYRETFDAMRESQESFRILLERVDIPVILISKNKEIIDINKALSEYLGWSDDELIGEDLDKILHKKDSGTYDEKIVELVSGEKDNLVSEMVCKSKKDEKISMKFDCSLVRDHEDSPLYVIGILEDGSK